MPIMITVREFDEKTNFRKRKRPGLLDCASSELKEYHRLKHHLDSEELLDCAGNIGGFIAFWANGLKKKFANGRWQYRDYFDQSGIVSELLRQSCKTFRELQDRKRARAAAPTQRISVPVNPPSPVAPMQPQPLAPPPPDPKVHFHCCHEAAEMIRMKKGRGRYEDVWKSVRAYAFAGKAMPRPWVTMHDLYMGLRNMGHDVAYVHACRMDHIINLLNNRTDQSPVLVCVSGSGKFNRVILCHGRIYTDAGRNQENGYKVKDHRTQPGDAILYENGDYDLTINGANEQSFLLPSLGYIKFIS